MAGLQQWWIRGEQVMSSSWICAKCLTLYSTASLFLNWREMSLSDGSHNGEELKACEQQLHV